MPSLKDKTGISEKKMMGSPSASSSHGNMIGGAHRTKDGEGRFMFRVGKDNAAEALTRKGAQHGGTRRTPHGLALFSWRKTTVTTAT